MYKSILLAADGSENSYRAAQQILNIAESEAHVTVLNVVEIDESKTVILHGANSNQQQKEKLSQITQFLEKNHIKHKIEIKHGEPAQTVVNEANRHQYEIIVLGTRGLNNFQEMMMGSVSHKVAKRSKIPVLIVK
ncbi:universal stress protein [Mammaliicoccus lentus]|uniref:universal stress protein n=1 Tax=Mammaliicoccus lentus TaxID=42858 RepID=UPI00374FB8AE